MAPNNPLPCHGNDKTMNLNSMVLTNIQASPYFKVQLFECKTYHEVIDEIYNKVSHLEPWEKGSRKTAGQTGMCGGVRGVGAGGIVSSAFCLLYKLFTLKLTSKQAVGLMNHADSPYIRALGFMYIRYTQNPAELWDWFEHYLEDEEEIDVKAGGGHVMTIGEMLHQWLTKLEWYSTLFPRIPVPIQKQIDEKLKAHDAEIRKNRALGGGDNKQVEHEENSGKGGSDHRHEDRRRASADRNVSRQDADSGPRRDKDDTGYRRDKDDSGYRKDKDDSGYRKDKDDSGYRRDKDDSGYRRDKDDSGYRRDKDRRDVGRHDSRNERSSPPPRKRSRSRERHHDRKRSRSHEKRRSRSKEKRRSPIENRERGRRETSFERDLRREKERQMKSNNDRSRDNDRGRRSRSRERDRRR